MYLRLPWLSMVFLQAHLLFIGHSISVKGGRQDELTCAPLSNQELYSSVKVSIGDPAQTFDLVADTGSDSCIVKDCTCNQCPAEWGGCFNGRKSSKSFKLPMFLVKEAETDTPREAPASMVMSFGSGDISTQVASDQVQLGAVQAYMENGLLLMVDHGINLKGHFEGILGLGRPVVKTEKTESESHDGKPKIKVPSFLETAGVRRFSMCFNHNADGTLGLKTVPRENLLTSTGKVHWSLNFHGLSIGELRVDLCSSSKCSVIPDSGTTLFSGPEVQIASIYEALCLSWQRCRQTHTKLRAEMQRLSEEGVEVEGTSERKVGLLESNPDEFLDIVSNLAARSGEGVAFAAEGPGWTSQATGFDTAKLARDASQNLHGATQSSESDSEGPGSFELPPALTLQLLLEHCEQWIEKVDNNKEMPALSFYVSGANGNKQEVKISPYNYVLSKRMDVEVPSIRNVFGFKLNTKHLERKKICTMAFTPTDYSTITDGQIWIMGTPLFYEYTAHYDRGGGSEDQVAMAFTRQDQEECGQCKGMKIVRSQSLIAEAAEGGAEGGRAKIGMASLNVLSHQPIVRNLTGVKFI